MEPRGCQAQLEAVVLGTGTGRQWGQVQDCRSGGRERGRCLHFSEVPGDLFLGWEGRHLALEATSKFLVMNSLGLFHAVGGRAESVSREVGGDSCRLQEPVLGAPSQLSLMRLSTSGS